MGLIKEQKNVDLSTKSEPWTEEELRDFRQLMSKLKAKNKVRLKQSETTANSSLAKAGLKNTG